MINYWVPIYVFQIIEISILISRLQIIVFMTYWLIINTYLHLFLSRYLYSHLMTSIESKTNNDLLYQLFLNCNNNLKPYFIFKIITMGNIYNYKHYLYLYLFEKWMKG